MPTHGMRLRKLVVHGFKSFADRTEFVFDSPVTGIVGPNGCGKSNVVDAFKWVLGEQSAKSLRGDAMMDVLFNGAATRKPAGMAEVILVFDNPKGPDDGPRPLAVDADEVAVGRRLYRDSASEYHLNGKASRLRDVRDLFMDTGVGVDAYSVIEQGRVSALLEANPAERRLIFEEAAGVSKFKAQRKEARRKLERVDQNLLRVNDVVAEVEKQLRGVKIQAGKARVYQEHAARLAELRLQLALHEYHVHHGPLGRAGQGGGRRHLPRGRPGRRRRTQVGRPGRVAGAGRRAGRSQAAGRVRAGADRGGAAVGPAEAAVRRPPAAADGRAGADVRPRPGRPGSEARRGRGRPGGRHRAARQSDRRPDRPAGRPGATAREVQGRPAAAEHAQPRGRAAQGGRAGPDAAVVAGGQPAGQHRRRTPQPGGPAATPGRPAKGRRGRGRGGHRPSGGTAGQARRGGGVDRRPAGRAGGDQAGRGRPGQAVGRREPAAGRGPRGAVGPALAAEGAEGPGGPPGGRERGREVGPAAAGTEVPVRPRAGRRRAAGGRGTRPGDRGGAGRPGPVAGDRRRGGGGGGVHCTSPSWRGG